jgi:hypothetical protein
LLAFHAAVIKRAETDGIPFGAAPYRILEDIENYNKLGGIQRQLVETVLRLNMVKQILARQNGTMAALMKLQY